MTSTDNSPRPPSSSGRPYTARPDTAEYFGRDPQYTYNNQEFDQEEEDDDESDAEGVFAFARPPTADAFHFAHNPQPQQSLPVAYPPRAFDPSTPSTIPSEYPAAGPSSLYSRHPYPHPQSPIESPPSTDSQERDNPYRLKRLPPQTASDVSVAHTTGTSRRSAVSSAISSREVHVSLPPTQEIIDEDYNADETKSAHLDNPESSSKPRPPSSATSFPTLDSREGSIKYVPALLFNLVFPSLAVKTGWSSTLTQWKRRTVLTQKSALPYQT